MNPQEREAFRDYVTARSHVLLRTAYLLTGQRADAEDLLQTALAKTYLAWDRIADKGALDAYVRRVMVNTQTSVWRRRRVDESLTAAVPEQAAPGVDLELHDQVWSALQALPRKQRAAVVLRYYEDLTETETARVLGCSVGTVKSQTSRALAKLRDHLVATDATYAADTRATLPLGAHR